MEGDKMNDDIVMEIDYLVKRWKSDVKKMILNPSQENTNKAISQGCFLKGYLSCLESLDKNLEADYLKKLMDF